MEVIVRDLDSTNGWGFDAFMQGLQVFQEPTGRFGEHRCRVNSCGETVEFIQSTFFGRRTRLNVATETQLLIVDVLMALGVLENT